MSGGEVKKMAQDRLKCLGARTIAEEVDVLWETAGDEATRREISAIVRIQGFPPLANLPQVAYPVPQGFSCKSKFSPTPMRSPNEGPR